jgi:hypothetical protein
MLDGVEHIAESRSGAPYALARVLVDIGIPDQPVETAGADGIVQMRFTSLHWMATRTIEESASTSIREGRYQERPDF